MNQFEYLLVLYDSELGTKYTETKTWRNFRRWSLRQL